LQHAANLVVAGDTVDVEAGNYAGFVMGWNSPQNGTASAPITWQASSGVVIDAPNNETADGIDLEGSSYIIIEGFTVDNTNGSITRAGIRSVVNTNVIIRDNTAEQCGEWGIFSGFSNNLEIEDNVAALSQSQHGIYVSNTCTNPQVIGNTVWGNNDCGIQLNADISQGGTGIITNALIEDNIIYDNGAAGGSAINCDGVQNSTIVNNLLYNNSASGISLYQIDGGGPSTNDVIADNTIVNASNSRWDINLENAATDNAVYNNILYNYNPAHGSIQISADSLPGFKSDYNVVVNGFTTDGGDSVQTLSQWQSATGQDLHSLIATPSQLFESVAANNYQESPTSPSIGAGTSTDAPSTDILGNPRPSSNGYDIGCYETAAAITNASIWSGTATPANPSQNDSHAVELGVKFSSSVAGTITGIRFYKGSGNTGTHVGHLWTSSGTLLATATFTNETGTGWQQANFSVPVPITAGTTYVASYYAPSGHYAITNYYFATSGVTNGVLSALSNVAGGGDGVYVYGIGGGFATSSYESTNYWVDIVFNNTPTVTAETPAPNATGVAVSSTVAATFSEAVQPGTVGFALTNGSGSPVSATFSYNSSNNTATWTPTAVLASGTTYTATLSGAEDLVGIPMGGPVSWSFTTVSTMMNASIWASTTTPANASSSDAKAVELGVKFNSTQAGEITGIRFYKGSGNAGTHVGHLWTTSGALLATATFTNETSTGWQQANFSTPVSISAGTTYVASYYAPNGHYAYNNNYFASSGVTSGVLSALSNSAGGGDGVYLYGTGGGFPTSSYESTNYWVDIVFSSSLTNSVASSSVALRSDLQSGQLAAALAGVLVDNPIGVLPETLLNTLAEDWLQPKLKSSRAVGRNPADQGGLGS